MALLTESSDDDIGAIGGGDSRPSKNNAFEMERCSEDLVRHITNSLDALSMASTESETDENMNRQSSGYSFATGDNDESGENLIEYSELLVPATKSYSAAVEETGVLLNLLEGIPSSSSSSNAVSRNRPPINSKFVFWFL